MLMEGGKPEFSAATPLPSCSRASKLSGEPMNEPCPLVKDECDPQGKAFLHNVELLGHYRIFRPWKLLDF